MIIPEKLIDATELILSDEMEDRVEFVIACGSEGYYSGKIIRSGILWKKTEKVLSFKKALNDLFQLCYNQIGDENT